MAAARKAKVDLVSTVDQAVAAMHWLTPADQVTVELARKYAAEIEDAAIRDAEVRPCTLALAVYTSYSAWAALRCFIGMSDQMSMVAADSPSGNYAGFMRNPGRSPRTFRRRPPISARSCRSSTSTRWPASCGLRRSTARTEG